jgi:MFS family permease
MVLGRRPVLWLACILNAASCAIQLASTSPNSLYIGRILRGFANGFFVTHSNVYTAEAAPAHLRGVTVALFAYWVNFGSILGTVVDYRTKGRMDKLSYQTPLACLYIVPTFFLLRFSSFPKVRGGSFTMERKFRLERLWNASCDENGC